MNITRRTFIAGSAGAIAAPLVLRAHDALASSGTVNVFAWGGYFQQNQIDLFEKNTGITVNLSTYGSNE